MVASALLAIKPGQSVPAFATARGFGDRDSQGRAERRMICPMGDDSLKNQHKLDGQKHEEHMKKDHARLENALHQHHPDRASTPEEILALKKQEEAVDAAGAKDA